MGDISPNFSRHEFNCRCGCGFNTVDVQIIPILEDIRRHWGAPVTINSAARCLEHNRMIGSTDKSQHVIGRACDISVKGVTAIHVYDYLDEKYPNQLGLGLYVKEKFVHIDTRETKARWT